MSDGIVSESWASSPEKLLRHRLKSLKSYDALIGDTLFVYALLDDHLNMIYVVEDAGIEVIRRKRVDSVYDFLALNHSEASRNLRFIQDGAIDRIPFEDDDDSEFDSFVDEKNRYVEISQDLGIVVENVEPLFDEKIELIQIFGSIVPHTCEISPFTFTVDLLYYETWKNQFSPKKVPLVYRIVA